MYNHFTDSKADIFYSSIMGGKRANPKVESFKKSFRKELSESAESPGV